MSASPRLFLHIGHPKTGTTSIQVFLFSHRNELQRYGIYVPQAGLVDGAHHGLTENYFSVRRLPSQTSDHLSNLRSELSRIHFPTVVLSSEAFIQENPKRLASLFRPRFEVFVIYYIRRQDLAVQSVYAQRVRSEIQRECRSLPEMLPNLIPRYRHHLDRFAAVFGPDHCLLRPFEKNVFLGGSLLADFCSLLGMPPETFPVQDEPRNQAFKRPYLAFNRQSNLLPLLSDEHRALGRALDVLSQADPTFYPRHYLSAEDRMAILNRCKEENQYLARTYLPSNKEPLFRDPPPSPEEPWAPLGPLETELQHRILDALPSKIRDLLEHLDRGIRLRQNGQPFLPLWPDDPNIQHQILSQRNLAILQRRVARLESLTTVSPSPLPPTVRKRKFGIRIIRAIRRLLLHR